MLRLCIPCILRLCRLQGMCRVCILRLCRTYTVYAVVVRRRCMPCMPRMPCILRLAYLVACLFAHLVRVRFRVSPFGLSESLDFLSLSLSLSLSPCLPLSLALSLPPSLPPSLPLRSK
jgi:hypothetical protein